MASTLVAMASNQVAMASNLIAMACNLIAMASNLVASINGYIMRPVHRVDDNADSFVPLGSELGRGGGSGKAPKIALGHWP